MSLQVVEDSGDESLQERYRRAVSGSESDPAQTVTILQQLQHEIARKGLFSKGESLEDISTSSLPFLLLEHHLAVAFTRLPTQGISEIGMRQENLNTACTLWNAFLQRLENLEQLKKEEKTQFQELVERMDVSASSEQHVPPPPLANRDAKIASFRFKQALTSERARLESLKARRDRLNIDEIEAMDDYDAEGLERAMALNELELAKAECFEEWNCTSRELPMIARMVQVEKQRQNEKRHHGDTRQNNGDTGFASRQPPPPTSGLKVTHISQAADGQLQFRQEEIRANVFKPGWNQPTMSLDEFAEREIRDAQEREARQKEAEARSKTQPRRYEQLLNDGLEDDKDLVDASAALDRQWDDFRDENPRGSGNKRGDVGDRNF